MHGRTRTKVISRLDQDLAARVDGARRVDGAVHVAMRVEVKLAVDEAARAQRRAERCERRFLEVGDRRRCGFSCNVHDAGEGSTLQYS